MSAGEGKRVFLQWGSSLGKTRALPVEESVLAAACRASSTVVPDEQMLRAAWARRRRSDWPATFEDAMADTFYARLVICEIKHPTPVPAAPRRHAWPFMAAPRFRPQPAANAGSWRPAAVFDIKRAAAGDRDD